MSYQTDPSFWINQHNKVRAEVGVPPVSWSNQLANDAAEYSKKCPTQHGPNIFQDGIFVGENLASGWPPERYSELDAFTSWENEKQNYSPGTNPTSATGHYTHIVNRKVKEIGCGCSICGQSRHCVCLYKPGQSWQEPPY